MILKYYHGYVSLDKLSLMMHTNQSGTTAYNIKETLNKLGFKSYGIKSKDILSLNLPCIAHVNIKRSYKHYIVVYKVNKKRKKLLIADPAIGIKKISFEDFQKIWTNITVQMKPSGPVVSEGEPKIWTFLKPYIKRNIKLIIFSYLSSITVGVLSLLTALYLPILIKQPDEITFIICAFMGMLILKNIFIFIKNKITINLNIALDKELSMDVFKKILNLPYRYYKRKTTGEITSYFNDLYIIRNFITQFLQIFLINIPIIIFLLFYLICINVFLKTLLFSLFLLALVYFAIRKRQIIFISEAMRNKIAVNSYLNESVMGFETIKNLNITSKIYQNFKGKYQNYITSFKKLSYKEENISLIEESIILVSVFFISLSLIKNLNVSSFVSIYILMTLLMDVFKNTLNSRYQIDEVTSALSNIIELINFKTENRPSIKATGDIIIHHLNYSFDENHVLKNINLKIEKSSKVLVTGDSGSGKSTLFKIVKGYYNNYSGSVKIASYEVNKYNITSVLYVSQKEILFTGTLQDNLSLKKLNYRNMKLCEVDQFIKHNYFLIEEDGFNLSSGQRQRIVLARALNQFQILIIDEGLNQVSIDMERRILKKLLKRYSFKTIIYISHRLDNLDLFDRYIKIQKGQVILDEKRNN